MGFTVRVLDVSALVAITNDVEFQEHSHEQEEIFRTIVAEGL